MWNKKRKLTLKFFQNLAHKKGGKCLSNTYTHAHQKLKWTCSQGHIWYAKACDVKNSNNWCKICKGFLRENICRVIFEHIFDTNFFTYRPDWLKNNKNNNMELDGYNKDLKIGFEHQGSQHYKKNKFFKGDLQTILTNDKLKLDICTKNRITLIIIPYTIKTHNLYNFIINELVKVGINIPEHTTFDLKNVYIPSRFEVKLEEAKQYALSKGGKCLSTKYIGCRENLEWKCSKGHIWIGSLVNVKNSNRWCAICKGSRLSLEQMKKLAKSKGGQCLSSEFKTVNHTLKWQCFYGHEWNAPGSRIKSGSWCKQCHLLKLSLPTNFS